MIRRRGQCPLREAARGEALVRSPSVRLSVCPFVRVCESSLSVGKGRGGAGWEGRGDKGRLCGCERCVVEVEVDELVEGRGVAQLYAGIHEPRGHL